MQLARAMRAFDQLMPDIGRLAGAGDDNRIAGLAESRMSARRRPGLKIGQDLLRRHQRNVQVRQ